MKVVGLTGGIGSGKTTIATMFEELGIPVYYADNEAKKLMNFSPAVKSELIKLMGHEAYSNGTINKSFIADRVFKDKNLLDQLNAIVHPAVRNHFNSWMDNQNSTYVIQENPLIFEKQQEAEFDYIITVTAPVEIRISRVIKRNAVSREQVLDRINNQMSEAHKTANASFVIHNVDINESKEEVIRIHKSLLA